MSRDSIGVATDVVSEVLLISAVFLPPLDAVDAMRSPKSLEHLGIVLCDLSHLSGPEVSVERRLRRVVRDRERVKRRELEVNLQHLLE